MPDQKPLRPSSTDRWLKCPGTFDLIMVRGEETTAIDCGLGTVLHELVTSQHMEEN